MKTIKISDAEYPLMEYIWANEPLSAVKLANYAIDAFSWKKNTTYTVITRLVERGALERSEPGFIVHPLVTRDQVQRSEVSTLLAKIFAGSPKEFFQSFLSCEEVTKQDLAELQTLLDEAKNK